MSFNFEDGSGFSAFALYNAIFLHFNSDSYNYFKYNGKTNVTKDSFSKRKDKYSFYKLSRKYNLQDLRNFYVANFLATEVKWIGDITGLEGEENYLTWQKRNQSLTYRFKQDILHLLSEVETPEEMLSVKSGDYPVLLKHVLQGDVAVETMMILNDIMGFFNMWNKKISDTVVWPSMKKRFEKYAMFMVYDKTKFKDILKESLTEHA